MMFRRTLLWAAVGLVVEAIVVLPVFIAAVNWILDHRA